MGVRSPGQRTAPSLPRASGPRDPGSSRGGCGEAGPRAGASATKARPPRPSPAGSADRSAPSPSPGSPSWPRAATGSPGAAPGRLTPPAGSRGSSRPAHRRAAAPRSPPTWRELRPVPTGRSLGPRGAQRPLARSPCAKCSSPPRPAQPDRRPHPGPRRPGAGTWREARGARHEALGPDGDAPWGARRPWIARGPGGGLGRRLAAPRGASASYFLSRFLLEGEEKH